MPPTSKAIRERMSAFATLDEALAEQQPAHGRDGQVPEHDRQPERGKVVARVLGEQHLPSEGGGQAKDHELGDDVTQRATGAVLSAWWSCTTSSARTPTLGGSGNALAGMTMPSTQVEGCRSARRGSGARARGPARF